MAGVAGLIGGVVALGVGKLVGGVMNKIGDAQTDAIGYDTLKRQLGDVNVSFFSVLQRSMHAASRMPSTAPTSANAQDGRRVRAHLRHVGERLRAFALTRGGPWAAARPIIRHGPGAVERILCDDAPVQPLPAMSAIASAWR